MDPNAALKTFIESLVQCNHEATLIAYTALADWLYRGGFEPDWRPAQKDLFDQFNPKTGMIEFTITTPKL